MKKLLALLLTLLMLFTLVACGENEQTPSGNDGTSESQQQEQTDPDTSEQNKTPSSGTTDSSDDVETVAGFLKVFGYTEDDIKPAHFVSFDDVELEGRGELGEVDSGGFITIHVDKTATTQEDINAWFEKAYAKMQQLAVDGKLYKNFMVNADATPLEELMALPTWETMPGGSCAYYYEMPIGKAVLNVATSYDVNEGVYRMSIAVMDFAQ